MHALRNRVGEKVFVKENENKLVNSLGRRNLQILLWTLTAISTQNLQTDLLLKENENFKCNQTLPSTHKFKYFLQNQFHVFTKIKGRQAFLDIL